MDLIESHVPCHESHVMLWNLILLLIQTAQVLIQTASALIQPAPALIQTAKDRTGGAARRLCMGPTVAMVFPHNSHLTRCGAGAESPTFDIYSATGGEKI